MDCLLFLFLAIFLQSHFTYGIKYLLVQIDNETNQPAESPPENVGTSFRKSQSRSIEKTIGCGKSSLGHSGSSRIIGGNEITPHSEPWLASICYQRDAT